MHLDSARSFQVWAYSVSHGQLLIRSPKSIETPENVDVAFFGVAMMELPAGFLGLKIEDASDQDIAAAKMRVQDPDRIRRVYALESREKRYLVAATDLRVSKNGFDYRETDLDFFTFLKPGQQIVEGGAKSFGTP